MRITSTGLNLKMCNHPALNSNNYFNTEHLTDHINTATDKDKER